MSLSKILLVADPTPVQLQSSFESIGFAVTPTGFSGIDPADVSRSNAVVILVSDKSMNTAQAICRRWRIELGEQYVPIIWLIEGTVPAFLGLDAGADAVLTANSPTEHVVSQLKALLRIQHLHSRLVARAAESQNLNQRLQQAYQQIDGDVDLTRRIHRGFLAQSFPEVANVRFAVCYRPRSRIGGDFYDVFRLDEKHVAFYVADAMGRGLPASSLLSIFVKKSIVGKEILQHSYRLVLPNEVLEKLNRDLVSLNLPEPPFVTMIYASIDCTNGTLSFARAAHPHPMFIPVDGEPQYWHSSGSLLGVFEGVFPIQNKVLRPGDKLLFFTDAVHPPSTGPGASNDPLPAIALKFRHLAAQPFVDQIARELLQESNQPDDFTLMAIEYT